eukprot:1708785-Rhodomonas_salina.1
MSVGEHNTLKGRAAGAFRRCFRRPLQAPTSEKVLPTPSGQARARNACHEYAKIRSNCSQIVLKYAYSLDIRHRSLLPARCTVEVPGDLYQGWHK